MTDGWLRRTLYIRWKKFSGVTIVIKERNYEAEISDREKIINAA